MCRQLQIRRLDVNLAANSDPFSIVTSMGFFDDPGWLVVYDGPGITIAIKPSANGKLKLSYVPVAILRVQSLKDKTISFDLFLLL